MSKSLRRTDEEIEREEMLRCYSKRVKKAKQPAVNRERKKVGERKHPMGVTNKKCEVKKK